MLGRWKSVNDNVKSHVDVMSSECIDRVDGCPQRSNNTMGRQCMPKGLYFCMVQYLPHPFTYIFATTGDYIIGGNCSSRTSGTCVALPLGGLAECRSTGGHLHVKVREGSISVLQAPQNAYLCRKEDNNSTTLFFMKETSGNTVEAFSHVDSAENCAFRVFSGTAGGKSRNAPSIHGIVVCSFAIRRVLLGMSPPCRPRLCKPGIAEESEAPSSSAQCSASTEYVVPVSRQVEVFRNMRIGKGGNGEVFLGIHRARGEAVAVKREPKDMLRHEFTLITEIRLDGPLLTYKAQDPHPSKFLGLLAHAVAVEVGNSAVAAAIAHHSSVDDDSDHLVLELVAGGELRKKIKSTYSSGMPVEMARAYIYQLVCGLVLIHSKHVIHRDLKTQNILVRHGETFEGDELKIIDFGNSAKVKPGTVFTKNYTTCFACAPEQFALTEKGYDYAIDVWALGTIFFELLTGQRLFECQNVNVGYSLINTLTSSFMIYLSGGLQTYTRFPRAACEKPPGQPTAGCYGFLTKMPD